MKASEKEKLFQSILDQHKQQLYRVCWGFTDQEQDVNDLFQETMIRIWQGLDTFQGKSTISTWAYRIAVNTCIYHKKKNKAFSQLLELSDHSSVDSQSLSPEPSHSFERMKDVRAAIQELNNVDKSTILLILEGCSYKEISEITGMTVNHIGVKVNRIKSKVKKIINKNSSYGSIQ